MPAQVHRGDLTVAISTGRASPALARKLREDLTQHFFPEYLPYPSLLKAVRARLPEEHRGHNGNARLLHQLVDFLLLQVVATRCRARIVGVLREILEAVLSPAVLEELVSQAFKETEGYMPVRRIRRVSSHLGATCHSVKGGGACS